MIYAGRDILYIVSFERGADRIMEPKAAWEGYDLGDGHYQSLPESWITEQAWPAWVDSLPEHLREFRAGPRGQRFYPRWLRAAWDCDNHASDFMAFCSRQVASMVVRVKEAGGADHLGLEQHAGTGMLCFSYMAATNGRRGGHKINLALTHKRGEEWADVRPFEPADGTFFNLTDPEWKSGWHICGR